MIAKNGALRERPAKAKLAREAPTLSLLQRRKWGRGEICGFTKKCPRGLGWWSSRSSELLESGLDGAQREGEDTLARARARSTLSSGKHSTRDFEILLADMPRCAR
jgi:hypothetical protein